MIHVRIQDANIEPVFFSYPDSPEIDAIVNRYILGEPEYDFVAEDGFGHHFWVIDDEKDIAAITEIFAGIPAFYVADGHHRTAAAALVGAEKRSKNPNHTGDEEYNYFMAVVFPESHHGIAADPACHHIQTVGCCCESQRQGIRRDSIHLPDHKAGQV